MKDDRREDTRAPLSTDDRATIGFLAFFLLMAFSIELYFVFHYDDVHRHADLFAKAYAIYSAGDMAYYGRGDVYVPLALETINVFFTQALNVLLLYAIVKRRAWRHPLQLAVAAYVAYSVVLYFTIAHVSGYQAMPVRNAWGYFIFYAPNMPWLVLHLYMACRSFAVITRRFRGAPAPAPEREGGWTALPDRAVKT